MKSKTLGIAFGLFVLLPGAQATTVYWQGTTTSGTATWDTTSSYWNTTDFTSPNTTFTTGADVVFGKFYSYSSTNKNATVDLNGGSVTANSITFNIPAGTAGITYTIQNGTINLSSTGTSLAKTGSRGDTDTISAAINLGASTTWDIQIGQVTVNGAVTGAGFNLTKTGTGTLQFSGTTTNTYNNLTVAEGAVQVSGSTAAFGGDLTIGDGSGNAGSASWSSQGYCKALNGKNVTINSDGVLKLGSGGANTLGNLTLAGGYITSYNTSTQILSVTKITATANTTQSDSLVSEIRLATSGSTEISVNNNVTLMIGNIIAQTPALLKTGDGTLTLSAANTYSGGNTIRAGTVRVLASSLDLTAGALGLNAATTTARTVTLGDASSGTSAISLISGTSGITTQRQITVTANGTGTVTIGGDYTSGTSTFSAYTGLSSVVLNRSANLTSAAGGTVVFANAITGTGGVTKVGGGNVSLNGTNTYTGATAVNEGELDINGSLASGTTTVNSGGTLGGSGTMSGVTFVNSGGTLNGSSLTLTGSATFNGASALAGTVIANGGIIAASGTLTLTGTTTGSATVLANALLGGSGKVNGSVSVTSGGINGANLSLGATTLYGTSTLSGYNTASSVTVASGSTTLTGTTKSTSTLSVSAGATLNANGTIDGSATVSGLLKGNSTVTGNLTLTSGTLAPGNSPGITKVEGNFTTDASSTLVAEVSGAVAGTSYDQVQVSGSVSLAGTLDLTTLSGLTLGETITLIDNTGSGTTTGYFATIITSGSTYTLTSNSNYTFTVGGTEYLLSYASDTEKDGYNNDVTLTVVPEPSTWAMLVGGMGVLALGQRMRRRFVA